VVMPGFVDSRAQLWTSRYRRDEAEDAGGAELWRYLSGIGALPAKRLEADARSVVAGMARHGTTTVLAGTSPASERPAELKMLRILAGLHGKPLDVIVAYCGGQLEPPRLRGDRTAYVEQLCTGMLPVIARRKLARFAVVNGEESEPAAARRYLDCARSLGLGLRVWAGSHAGLRLAMEAGAASVALDDIAEAEIGGLAQSDTMALVTPASLFEPRHGRNLPARALIEAGVAIALASGFGLDGHPTYNMQMVVSLACSEMGMSPAEAISAATINSARALGCEARCGSLEPGKQADMLLLNVEDYRDFVHGFGINHVHMVLKNGAALYREGEVDSWTAQ
jgi:imidazolonepropionase